MKNQFKTSDLYLASAFIADGHRVSELRPINHKSVEFVFSISPKEAQELADKYWDKSLVVPARALVEAMNELKTRIHNRV